MALHCIENNRFSVMSRQRKEQPAKGKVKTYTGAIIRLARYAMVASMHHAMLKPIP